MKTSLARQVSQLKGHVFFVQLHSLKLESQTKDSCYRVPCVNISLIITVQFLFNLRIKCNIYTAPYQHQNWIKKTWHNWLQTSPKSRDFCTNCFNTVLGNLVILPPKCFFIDVSLDISLKWKIWRTWRWKCDSIRSVLEQIRSKRFVFMPLTPFCRIRLPLRSMYFSNTALFAEKFSHQKLPGENFQRRKIRFQTICL